MRFSLKLLLSDTLFRNFLFKKLWFKFLKNFEIHKKFIDVFRQVVTLGDSTNLENKTYLVAHR